MITPLIATPFPNQPPPYEGRNLYLTDVALQEAVAREGGLATTELEHFERMIRAANGSMPSNFISHGIR